MVLHMERVRRHLNMKVFVDSDDDIRLTRRIMRDIQQRGRHLEDVIEQYCKFVKPAHDQYVMPSRRYADIIIPWHRENTNQVAIDLIVQHILSKLSAPDLLKHFPNLKLIPSNYQIRGMHTVLRDRKTSKNDFVFYADRLNRLVVEAGLGQLPFKEYGIETPTGHRYTGVQFARKICGVSVIRSGESMETALRACCKGIKIGKILVYRHREARILQRRTSLECYTPDMHSPARSPSTTGALGPDANGTASANSHPEETYIYEKLPADIAERHVLLMDPVLATGNSACRAIQVLLDKGVKEERILFLSLIAAPEGVKTVCGKFPYVKVITSELDQFVDNDFQVVPGVGEFGDRYFCD